MEVQVWVITIFLEEETKTQINKCIRIVWQTLIVKEDPVCSEDAALPIVMLDDNLATPATF